MKDPWSKKSMVRHVSCLLRSFRHWTGRNLIEPTGDEEEDAKRLFEAPFVVLSHGVEKDPILNYGNGVALELWEMTWDSFINTPSRLTAEALNREERSRLLKEVTGGGYSYRYRGIRVTSRGRRFRIDNATVWNLLDEEENYCGQAATFDRWTYL